MKAKEVKFHEYCKTCMYEQLPEEKDPCNECLSNPGIEDSRVPICWEEKK